MVGPPLTTVGQKLGKAQLYEAILYPSNAILMEYETWVVNTKKGDVFSGLKVEDTPDHVTIKDIEAKYHDVDVEDIDRKVMQKVSLMPESLERDDDDEGAGGPGGVPVDAEEQGVICVARRVENPCHEMRC